jgi:hypothetical protein
MVGSRSVGRRRAWLGTCAGGRAALGALVDVTTQWRRGRDAGSLGLMPTAVMLASGWLGQGAQARRVARPWCLLPAAGWDLVTWSLGLAQPVTSWACNWATVGYLAPIYIFSDICGYPRVQYNIRTRSDVTSGRVWVRPAGKILYLKPNPTGRVILPSLPLGINTRPHAPHGTQTMPPQIARRAAEKEDEPPSWIPSCIIKVEST